jgi:D-lactate dehydrogenase (cytochrome)
MKCAARHRAPSVSVRHRVVARRTRNAFSGGVSIDFTMTRVLADQRGRPRCHVEPGVTHRRLNKVLNNKGLAFWVDPGADATIGGMAATARLGHDGGALRHDA